MNTTERLGYKIFGGMKQSGWLLWVDLEMSGLSVDTNRILEVACILTDLSCTVFQPGPEIVVHCDKAHLDTMDAWCQSTHSKSGLISKCLSSTTDIHQA